MFVDEEDFKYYLYDVAQRTLEVDGLDKLAREALERIVPLNLSPSELVELLYFLPTSFIDDFMVIYKNEYGLDQKYFREFDELLLQKERAEFDKDVFLHRFWRRERLSDNPEEKLLDRAEMVDVISAHDPEVLSNMQEYDGKNMFIKKAIEMYSVLTIGRYANEQYQTWQNTCVDRVKVLLSKIEELETKVSV